MGRQFKRECKGYTITIVQGDITEQSVDAIANAANEYLAGGGGVDGAIHRIGGPQIMKELRKFKRCETGNAVVTGAGELDAKYIFHAVGPVYRGGSGNEAELLRSAYDAVLDLASEHSVSSIAVPSISTGVYGYPTDEASRIALNAITEHSSTGETLKDIRFVLFDMLTYEAFRRALENTSC